MSATETLPEGFSPEGWSRFVQVAEVYCTKLGCFSRNSEHTGAGLDSESAPGRLANNPPVFALECYLVSRRTREPTRLSTGITTSIGFPPVGAFATLSAT